MNKFINNVKAFMNDEEGLSVVEYVEGAALLVVALGSVFTTLGSSLTTELSTALGSI